MKLFDGGAKVRLSALGTMFLLGATLGRSISLLPWWAYFAGAVVIGFAMVLLFLKWCDELERG